MGSIYKISRSHSSEQSVSLKNWLLQLPACEYASKSHGQASICRECSSQDCMRSLKIRPHHKPHARLATLAMRSAMGDVQAMSCHIQISPWLCTRLPIWRNSAFRLHDRTDTMHVNRPCDSFFCLRWIYKLSPSELNVMDLHQWHLMIY